MKRVLTALALLILSATGPAGAVGFQWATAPDGDQAPLQVAIWYPSSDPTADAGLVAFDMDAAVNGKISTGRYPLIVMSHGTGGMALNSFDTAMALANAGFVVASVTHTGDNYRDRSTSFTRQDFVDRHRHITRLIDFMLATWSDHASIDPSRIGIFGHSAGGTTSLILLGGVADLGQVVAFCRNTPNDWSCREAQQRGRLGTDVASAPVSGPDPRIKAAVLVAPAISVVFQPQGLAAVKMPVQLWVGDQDDIVRDAPLLRTLLPTSPDYHLVQNGGHFAFLTPCNDVLAKSAPDICVDPPGFNRAAFLQGFQQSVIAFYQKQLSLPRPSTE